MNTHTLLAGSARFVARLFLATAFAMAPLYCIGGDVEGDIGRDADLQDSGLPYFMGAQGHVDLDGYSELTQSHGPAQGSTYRQESRNSAGITQYGEDNQVNLEQEGSRNRSNVVQIGAKNETRNVQYGTDNNFEAVQYGYGNTINYVQSGSGMSITVRQQGIGRTVNVWQSK